MRWNHNLALVLMLLLSFNALPALAIDIDYDKLAPVRGLGINGRIIAFSTGNDRPGSLTHAFNLGTMSLDDEWLRTVSFKKIEPAWKEYSLTFGMQHNNHSRLELRQLGNILYELDWSNLPGMRHHVYGFVRGGLWVTGGNSGVLEIYNTQAEKLATLEGHTGTISAIAYNEKWLVSGDTNGLILLWDLDEVTKGKKRIQPYLYLVYSPSREWAIWSGEGLFSSSPNGYQLLNIPPDTVRTYLRPDLLAKKITLPQQFHRLAAAELQNDSGVFNPPAVSIVNPPTVSPKRDVEITAKICDGGGGVQSVTLYLRGAPIAIEEASRGVAIKEKGDKPKEGGCDNYTRVVSLVDGENDLTLVASNFLGKESTPSKAVINYESEKKKKPKLHIVTIAVANYADKNITLKYPVDDAKAIGQALEKASYGTFDSVRTYTLFDALAKKENIEYLFGKLKKEVNPEDVFVLFIAGHGVFSGATSEYYFIPYDVDTKNLLATAIGSEELTKLLANINAAQSLLLIDTCQSGGFDGVAKEVHETNAAQLNFVHRLGRASLMASSKEQAAFEGVRGHGAFTSIILDALRGGADYTGDMLITVDELSVYVSKHLPELTERKWGYRQEAIRNTTGHDFVLGGLSR